MAQVEFDPPPAFPARSVRVPSAPLFSFFLSENLSYASPWRILCYLYLLLPFIPVNTAPPLLPLYRFFIPVRDQSYTTRGKKRKVKKQVINQQEMKRNTHTQTMSNMKAQPSPQAAAGTKPTSTTTPPTAGTGRIGSSTGGGEFLSEFPGLKLYRQDGSLVTVAEALKGKRYCLLYFAAHWIPSCMRFTPLLADFYNDHADRLGFEVLFISFDRQESRMMSFFQNRCSNYVIRRAGDGGAGTTTTRKLNTDGTITTTTTGTATSSSSMLASLPSSGLAAARPSDGSVAADGGSGSNEKPRRGVNRKPIASGMASWLALPFHETLASKALTKCFHIKSIPRLVVLSLSPSSSDGDGGGSSSGGRCRWRIVTTEGRAMVMRDENADDFPWPLAGDATQQLGWFPSGSLVLRVVVTVALCLLIAYYYLFASSPLAGE